MYLRLRQLRLEHGLTQEQVGKLLYVNQSMYSRYENGRIGIPLDALATLAKYYQVSADYILGLTDIPTPYSKSTRKIYLY
ncbi:MAG: helix-turn-helix domain-containing protein [Oscillospiraceae bacterium]|nr:helix-turn-helix domain-containing protein [Oscillospiraceae bacterium]